MKTNSERIAEKNARFAKKQRRAAAINGAVHNAIRDGIITAGAALLMKKNKGEIEKFLREHDRWPKEL